MSFICRVILIDVYLILEAIYAMENKLRYKYKFVGYKNAIRKIK